MKNWKTTLGGLLAALGLAMTESQDESLQGFGKAVEAIGLFLVGFGAKDYNSTGTTKP